MAKDMKMGQSLQKDCPIEKRACNGAGLRYLNRKFRAVGSGAERVGQRVSDTLSALEYTNLMVLALVLGTLEPGAHRRRVKFIVADLNGIWERSLHFRELR